MEINILNHEKNTLEFEISGAGASIPEMLTNKLSGSKSVEFVSYKIDHPLSGKPRVIVKTKSKDALEVTLEALEEIKGEVAEFRKAFKGSTSDPS